MGEEALVDSQIAESISLVKNLDGQGEGPTAALWHYFADAEAWRFLIAGPSFDMLLPKDEAMAYQKIAKALSSAQATSLTIGEIKLVKTDYPLLKAVRFMVRTPPGATVQAHFKDTTLNNIFISEMLVLRSA
jgi:hypothetical protein